MASTFFGLQIGKTGLYAYKAALDTTAHNIANTETPGYTRQVMSQQAAKALRMNSTYGMAGTGVEVLGVKQLRDEYYDIKFRTNSTIAGEYSGKSRYMDEIENYFNEVSVDGFTTTFNKLFDSIQELSKNPSSLTARTQMINYGKTFSEYINDLSYSLRSVQEDCNFEIRNRVDQINSTAQQIAALTKQIITLEVNGGTANDLRDQRALLVDELSEIVPISVTEKTVGEDGSGVTSYTVKIDGQTLVDTNEFYQLKVVPRKEIINQNDIDGLYDIVWQNGQSFNVFSPGMGGTLRGLFEVRDGNNQFHLSGKAQGEAGDNYIVLTESSVNSVEKLHIPQTGTLTVGNREYKYVGFEVVEDTDTGQFTYNFELEESLTVDAVDEAAMIGRSIDYKGIPYYMNQMSEFVRTFAKAFNDIHREGKDALGNSGMDFFSATHRANGRSYVFGPYKDSDDNAYYEFDRFNSQSGGYEEDVPLDRPLYGSYYFMTASNFTINSELVNDPKRLATSSDIINGVEKKDIVEKLLLLKDNKSLFKQGSASGFMETLVAEIGIDSKKARNLAVNQENILQSITNQRLSVSGVDTDEEAMNLIRYQSAYNLSAKVISVMDEIYDKLINYMGV